MKNKKTLHSKLEKFRLFTLLFFACVVQQALFSQSDPSAAVPKYEIPDLKYPAADAFVITYNILDYGADPTGSTDNAEIVQTLLDKMGAENNSSGKNNGGILFFPEGKYLINKSIRLPKGVTIRGEWKAPKKGEAIVGSIIMTDLGRGKDTEINKNDEIFSLIRMEPSSCVKDLAFWYPEQKHNNITPYPPTILYGRRGHWGNDYCTVQNITLINSYDGIVFSQDGIGGAPNVYNVYGTPLRKGIEIDNIAEVGRIEGANFSPEYWAASGLPDAPANNKAFKHWMKNNATGIVMRRNDWTYTSRVNIEGYFIGFHAIVTRYGPGLSDRPNGQNYDMTYTDCKTAIYAQDPQYTGIMFHKINIIDCDYGVFIPAGAGNTVQFSDCLIKANKYAIASDGQATTRIFFNQCKVISGKVETLGGTLVLTDSDLNNETPHITLGANARGIITGNRFDGDPDIQNKSMYKCEIDHTPLNKPRIPEFPYKDPWTLKQKPDRTELYLATSEEFGAVANNDAIDNTAAIQKALDKAAADGGGIVYLPPGRYKVSGSLSIPTGVELKGAMDVSSLPTGPGSILEAYGNKDNENGEPLVKLSQGSGIRGISINYPEQKYDELLARDNGGGGLTPYKYPYSIRGNKNVYIVNVSFRSVYKGIDLFTNKCDNAYVEYVGGHFFQNGIHVGGKSENVLVRNTQCNTIAYAFGQESKWGSWSNSSPNGTDNTPAYQQNSRDLEFFTLGDCKNLYLFNNFYFGCQRGCVFANEGDGPSGIALGHGIDSAVKALYYEKIGEGGFDLIGSQIVSLPCQIEGGGGRTAMRYIETAPEFTGESTLYSADFWGQAYYGVEIGGGTINLHTACLSAPGSARFAQINTEKNGVLNLFASSVQNSSRPINNYAEAHFSAESSILSFSNLNLNECILFEHNLPNSAEINFENTPNRIGWIATASKANFKANYALDGDPSTRWDTEATLLGNEWFAVDMLEPQTFNTVILDQGSSSGDYPIGYEIYTSDDGVNWGEEPLVTGAGTSSATTINLPSVQNTRYIKIVQIGQTGRYWSIHEFYIANTKGDQIEYPVLLTEITADNMNIHISNGRLYLDDIFIGSKVNIFDISGKKVKSQSYNSSGIEISSGLGIYIVVVQGKENSFRKKVIVN